MAIARKPLLKPGEFFDLTPEGQWKEVQAALENLPSGKIIHQFVEGRERIHSGKIIHQSAEDRDHIFVPADEQNKKSLKSVIGYHGGQGHEQAIERAVSNYLTDKMNSDLIQVTAHEHNKVQGFKVLAKPNPNNK